MIVRVFVPKDLDLADGSTFDGTDHEFPVLPHVGHSIRFTDERQDHFKVERVGFIQEGYVFVPAVWCKGDPIQRMLNAGRRNWPG